MHFQDILQEIASNLMDSNLFQLEGKTFCKTYRWVLVNLGLGDDIFSSICGTYFWKIPDEQFNLAHWSFG